MVDNGRLFSERSDVVFGACNEHIAIVVQFLLFFQCRDSML